MRVLTFSLSSFMMLLLIASCGAAEEAAPTAQPDQPAQQAQPESTPSADPLSGAWTGNWGPSERDRNDVTLELMWDGTNLTGTVNPGPNAIALQQSRFNPANGEIHLEADAQGPGGATIHYIIDGKVEGNTMTGTWNHPQRAGDFTITRR